METWEIFEHKEDTIPEKKTVCLKTTLTSARPAQSVTAPARRVFHGVGSDEYGSLRHAEGVGLLGDFGSQALFGPPRPRLPAPGAAALMAPTLVWESPEGVFHTG